MGTEKHQTHRAALGTVESRMPFRNRRFITRSSGWLLDACCHAYCGCEWLIGCGVYGNIGIFFGNSHGGFRVIGFCVWCLLCCFVHCTLVGIVLTYVACAYVHCNCTARLSREESQISTLKRGGGARGNKFKL